MKDGLNPADLPLSDLEQFCNLPGPIDLHMIEKTECEDNPALPIYCYETAIADTGHDTASCPDSNCCLQFVWVVCIPFSKRSQSSVKG